MLKKTLRIFALAALAFAPAAGAATVSVAYGTATGIVDMTGTALVGGLVKFGHFTADPAGIGPDLSALDAAFIEVGSTASDSAGSAGFFETSSFTFDDGDSFEGVPYSSFLGAPVYALISNAGGTEVGVARFNDTFRPDPTVGVGLPNSVANVALDDGAALGIIGGFTGPEIFPGATPAAFQLVPIPEPSHAVLLGLGLALTAARRRRS